MDGRGVVEDPTADELVNRHRSIHSMTPPTPKRPPLTVTKRGSSIIGSIDSCSSPVCTFGRDYVYSLHQNVKSSLLYGKNNVLVNVAPGGPPLKGYLSLHQNSPGNVTIKWTPNQLMHSSSHPTSATGDHWDNNWLWRHTLNINIHDIIYLHIHQYDSDRESPTTMILVGCDGIQHPPMQFPIGHHSLAFLSCLESGLAPCNRLDPPLWLCKSKGKILPRLRRRTSLTVNEPLDQSSPDSSEPRDYVFRIVQTCVSGASYMEQNNNFSADVLQEISISRQSDSDSSQMEERRAESVGGVDDMIRKNFNQACLSIGNQILARAFYGWLAYCGHLRTIRTHLMSLFDVPNDRIVDTYGPVNEGFWKKCRNSRTKMDQMEFLSRVYHYGIDENKSNTLRQQTWPYLLGLVDWADDFEQIVNSYRAKYYSDVVKWEKVEKVVKARDKEAFAAARRRYEENKKRGAPFCEPSISNEVFEESDTAQEQRQGQAGTMNALSQEEDDEVTTNFGINLHRIEKDVERCDRTSPFFSQNENLGHLKSILCTYVYRNLQDGYIQGMCDIAAPLFVIFGDEPLVLACFEKLMQRLRRTFYQNTAMDDNLAYMSSLIKSISTLRTQHVLIVMDPEFYEYMAQDGDATHLFFSYRWFLLDFKRELTYEQVFRVWEVIWAASSLITNHFHLFFALALIMAYRHIIIDNRMDFSDVIKFYNEMVERHNVDELLDSARNSIQRLQAIIADIEKSRN